MSEPPGQSSITNRATWPKPAAAAEAEHGPLKAEEVQALRDQLHQARREQGRSDVT